MKQPHYIFWIISAVVVATIFFGSHYDMFYVLVFLGLIIGAALIFTKKSQNSWEYVPRLIAGSIFYGLLAGIFMIAFPVYSYIQEPSITFNYYFWEFVSGWVKDILTFGAVSAFLNFLAGLSMIVIKGFYYIIKERI